MQPVELPQGPFQKVAVDVVGPFDTATHDCRYAIMLLDYYSKWSEVAFTSSVTTATLVTFLTSVFAHEGNPAYIVTDNGSQFCSSTFQDFLKDNGITHIRTSVYHAQANGAVERFNRVLKNFIQTAA